jgi:hypothetical protein
MALFGLPWFIATCESLQTSSVNLTKGWQVPLWAPPAGCLHADPRPSLPHAGN